MAIGNFSLPVSSGIGNLIPAPYVRPADWLEIDSLVSLGEQKFVGLVAVFEDSNFIAVNCIGAYTVDWGDGTVINYASGVSAYYNYSYASFPGTECSRGYRQAIMKITPQSGQYLTAVSFNINHNQSGLNTGTINGLLDVKLCGSNIITLTFVNKNKMLEQVDFIGTNSITNFTNAFGSCIRLVKIKNLWTNSGTNFTSLFENCYALEHLPNINTSEVTVFQYTFKNCYMLKSLPTGIDFSKSTSLLQTFWSCYSIVEFPTINAPLCSVFQSTFQSCNSILKNPKMVTSPTITKNFTSTFSFCLSMKEFKYNDGLWTKQGGQYASMFAGCASLETMPDIFDTTTTAGFNSGMNGMFSGCTSLEKAPMMDLSKTQNLTNIFSGCTSLKIIPSYTIGVAASNLSNFFSSCYALSEVPNLIFTQNINNATGCFYLCVSLVKAPNWNLSFCGSVNQMFTGCSVLASVPEYDLAAVTSATNSLNLFQSCSQLQKGKTIGLKYAVTYSGCKLSASALVDIFNGLGIAAGAQSITITGNWGASLLTPTERAIATGKGWTIVG